MAIAALEREIGTKSDSFTVHRWDPRRDSLLPIKHKLMEIGGHYYSQRVKTGRKFIDDFLNPANSVILLGDSRRFLIGYAYATREGDNATIQEIAVDPDTKDTGAVERMMLELQKDLLQTGALTMDGYFPIDNGYADLIAKVYANRVIENREEGSARFLSIDLRGVKKSNVIPFPSSY